MKFGLDKCAKATFLRGKLLKSITLDSTTIIKDLEPKESYKYLGVTEGDGIQHSSMREEIRKECFRRVRAILRSELNARNRIDAINSLALPVVTYSFTIINWSLTEIKKADTKIRKLLTMHRMHHPKSDVNRLYLFLYMSIYLHFTLRKIIDKKQTYKITQSPDTNIPESTWEYKITNNNNIYIKRKLLIKFRFTD